MAGGRFGLLIIAMVLAGQAGSPVVAGEPVVAASHAQGIADSGQTTFASPLWPGLNVIRARVIVPYDVALRPASDVRRQQFEAWLTNAQNAGATRNVGLARIPEPTRPGYGRAPDEATYRAAFGAFVAAYGARVDAIGPWNEPNFRPADGSRALLPGGIYYYRWAAVDCPTCLLAAGEFAGTQSSNYLQKYKRHLGYHRPNLWSAHNYADVIRYQVSGDNGAAELKTFLRELYCTTGHHCVAGQTDWSSGNLWIGATGAYYQLDCQAHNVPCDPGTTVHVLGEQSQCQAAAFINRFSNLSGKITRIYFYTFTDGRSGDNTGIVNAAGTTPRKAYYAVRDRAESCVY
jgi:hypothetical protein